jgi:O-methyltransferase
MSNWLKRTRRLYFGDAATKRKVWYFRLMEKCEEHGLEMYRLLLSWPHDPLFRRVSQDCEGIRGLPNDRRFFLLATARVARDLQGDSAECGVRFGASSLFILNGLDDPDREHHLFDSFEGLSEPTKEDHPSENERSVWKSGDLAAAEEVVHKNLSAFSNCRYYKGWIPDRFDEVSDRLFSFVHIDVDLYKPTLDSLKFFYPRMRQGGIILCDDYGSSDCPGATRAFDEFFRAKEESIFHIPTGQGMVIKSSPAGDVRA